MFEYALRRHDLVWLRTTAAARAVAAGPCCASVPEAMTLLAAWTAAGRPLIATRQAATLAPGQVQLGLALPPQLGKYRLAFILPKSVIARIEPPPLLAEIKDALPPVWRAVAARLLAVWPIHAVAPRVFGSVAMSAHTGLNCLGPKSDLDLLFEPRDRGAACALLDALRTYAVDVGEPRIDGEIRNPDGHAVAWRELVAATGKVLAKHDRDLPCLMARADFEAAFDDAAEAAA